MTNEELIRQAKSIINPHKVDDRLLGNVGAVLVTNKGNVYSGVCIDTGSGTGFCAEAAAIGTMVTAGEYEIAKIVAVWIDDEGKHTYVLPPCGRCREFIRQIDERNLDTNVILGKDTVMKLKELLPYYAWPEPLD
jgi:cytidine deaminase